MNAYTSLVRIDNVVVLAPVLKSNPYFKEFMDEIGLEIPRVNLLNSYTSVKYGKSEKNGEDIVNSLIDQGYSIIREEKSDEADVADSIVWYTVLSEDRTHFFDFYVHQSEDRLWISRREFNSTLNFYSDPTRVHVATTNDGLIYFFGTTTNTDEIWESIK